MWSLKTSIFLLLSLFLLLIHQLQSAPPNLSIQEFHRNKIRPSARFSSKPILRQLSRIKEEEITDEDLFDLAKRQTSEDYGHLRFGKRDELFDDYGHMRFGRSGF